MSVLLFLSALAVAAPEPRLLLLDAKVGDVPPEDARALAPLLLQALQDSVERAEVIAMTDLARLMELEGERVVAGCDQDMSCMAEIAAAMGAELVVAPELNRLGDTYVLQLTVFDSAAARVIGRETVRAESVERIASDLSAHVHALLQPLARSERITLAARHPVATGPSALAITGFVGLGLGGALLVGSGVGLGAAALLVNDTALDPATRTSWQDSRWLWVGGLAAGVVTLGVGGALLVIDALE